MNIDYKIGLSRLLNFLKLIHPLLVYPIVKLLIFENMILNEFDWTLISLLILSRFIIGYLLKFYNLSFKLASVEELLVISGTVFLGSLSCLLIAFIIRNHFSFKLIFFELVISIFLISFLHVANRIISIIKYHIWQDNFSNILIIGEGIKASSLIKEIKLRDKITFKIIGLIETQEGQKNRRVNGVPVIGSVNELDLFIYKYSIQQIIIALDKHDARLVDKAYSKAKKNNIECKMLASNIESNDFADLSLNKLRDIDLADLIGRDEIVVDSNKISEFINNKVILVTGGAGSIGSELCRQLLKYGPKRLIIIDQAETPSYELDLELIEQYKSNNHKIYIADIRNKERLKQIFNDEQPQLVFHAAAYKHVPLMEYNIDEALSVNVKGTKNCADLANEFHSEAFIMISTDKAVNPTNVMGCSKRIAELYVQALNESSATQYITTRFGNVLGSNGSVIPRFTEQIEKGGPITVTHPDITRFFMLIPEAVRLVLQAAVMGKGGEIYLFDMGSSVKIIDLAEKMIKLAGLVPYKDIKIEFTGLRPGEKIFEEMLIQGEDNIATEHNKIVCARSINHEAFKIFNEIAYLIEYKYNLSNNKKIELMKNLVKEYEPNRVAFRTSI